MTTRVGRAKTGARALVIQGVPLDAAESLVDIAGMFFPTPRGKRQKEFIDELAKKVGCLEAALAASPIADPESFAAFATGVFRQVAETAERRGSACERASTVLRGCSRGR